MQSSRPFRCAKYQISLTLKEGEHKEAENKAAPVANVCYWSGSKLEIAEQIRRIVPTIDNLIESEHCGKLSAVTVEGKR